MSALGPNHFHREKQGTSYLSRTYESSDLFSPFCSTRMTVNDEAYQRYRRGADIKPRTPMGMDREYGGRGPINLPPTFTSKHSPPPVVGKGHEHFGSGVNPYPRGEPIEQFYDLTPIKKSNVRTNDELAPKPQVSDMGALLIDKPFPGEHPYASHISNYALFPKFDSAEDPKRGVAARSLQPIPAEMPSNAYDVTIMNKTKGAGLRQEMQALPTEGHKRALTWNGENNFDQVVKSHGHKQSYYPTPIKTYAPNLQKRRPDMTVTPRTANALRNVERDQWQTTYDRSHTGLGDTNPMKLDNLGDKTDKQNITMVEDDSLAPRSYKTFDPPRPLEGRIARSLHPRPHNVPKQDNNDSSYIRKMTKSEVEEHRLWNGREYLNFPDPVWPDTRGVFKHQGAQWKTLQQKAHSEPNLEILAKTREGVVREDVPYRPITARPTIEEGEEGRYLSKLRKVEREKVQQVESQNRWKDLELAAPNHDIGQLNIKYKGVNYQEDHPPTFYNHEGKYLAERSGLYKTSYDPYMLEHQMNKEGKKGDAIMNTMHSHEDALRLPMHLNVEMDQALLNSKTNPRDAPMFGDRPAARDILEPYQYTTEIQRRVLQPVGENVDVKTLENGTVLTESTMQSSYNVPKFLQENVLSEYARNEPLGLMSNENDVLNDVRTRSSPKKVQFRENITVAEGAGIEPLTLKTATITTPRKELPFEDKTPKTSVTATQYSSTHAQYMSKPNEKPPVSSTANIFNTSTNLSQSNESTNQIQRQNTSLTYKRQRDPLVTDAFGSLSTNFAPAGVSNSMAYRTSYDNQFPTHSLSYKTDDRFDWTAGSGVPRPQTTLLRIQNKFSKTEARKKFHDLFTEGNPDLHENTSNVHDKKHRFGPLSAQEIHG